MTAQPKGDRERFEASLARLWQIYEDIGTTANEVSTWRCPYKNARDRCTANFGCRNQSFADGPGKPATCIGSDNLDYRSAWEL